MEFVENIPDESEEDALVASIARKLNEDERKVFLNAMDKVRKEAGKGRVRISTPSPEEQLILDTFPRYDYNVKMTAEALGLDIHRVYYITRKWNARPVDSNISGLKHPSEHMLRFMRTMWADGQSMNDMALAVQAILQLENTPGHYMMKNLCDKAGIDTTRPKFDKRLYPELVADFDAISEKYGFAVGTLHQHYMRAKKQLKGLPT